MKARRAGRAVAVLAAACGAVLGTTWAAAAPQPVAWGTTSSAPAGARGQLLGVAAASASDVLAVGGVNPGQPPTALVLHWNGSAWRQVSVPGIGALDAVTTAPGRVWIAGGDTVEQFDGTAWTKLPALPVQAQDFVALTGLADNASGLWAVGDLEFSCGEGGTCTASYAALWNGTAWTQLPAGGGTGLSGVVAAGSQ